MNTKNTSLTIWLLSLFVSLAFTQTAQCSGVVTLEGRESSLLPQGKKFRLVWNGEVIPHHFHANGYGADYLGFSVPRRSKDADTGKFNRENSVKLDNI